MRIVRSIAEMRAELRTELHGTRNEVRRGGSIGLVPTMGALHEGHLSLVRAAVASCDFVVATIFVNPLQFGPTEDFSKYPRTFAQDRELLAAEGVDLLFAPASWELAPANMTTVVDVGPLACRLDGAARPEHFEGVATIVAKLFHIVQPDRAFFGQKDAAQVAVLRAMVRDLNFAVELVVCPTVREEDGLALSSRNLYLSAAERSQALALSRSLRHSEQRIARGEHAAADLQRALIEELQNAEGVRLEYAYIVDPRTLEPVSDIASGALIAVAAWVGETRLIDNIVVAPRSFAQETSVISAQASCAMTETSTEATTGAAR